jgi:hypothetical protein
MTQHRPPNVPQRHANQAMHARYAAHARTFFLSDFVSIENKGSKIQIPKLDVAGSIPVARSNVLSKIAKSDRVMTQKPERPPKRSPSSYFKSDNFSEVWCVRVRTRKRKACPSFSSEQTARAYCNLNR